MPLMARLLPMARHHPIIKHGFFFTAILPLSAALYSLYHASQSPFFMIHKRPLESWQNDIKYKNYYKSYASPRDLSTSRNDRPYFEYKLD